MIERPAADMATVGRGAICASVAAGPVFLLVLEVARAIKEGEPLSTFAIPPDYLLPIIAGSALVGLAFSLLPVALGTSAMVWISNRNVAMRFWPVWPIVGGLLAGLPFVAVPTSPWDDAPLATVMGGCGAICAAIVRLFIRWRD